MFFTLPLFFPFRLIFLFLFLGSFHLLPSCPFYSFSLCSLSLQLSYSFSESQGYFFLTLSVSSPFYLGILITQRLHVLFRLSFAQLMRQMLRKNPFFYAKVKDLLSSCIFQKFPWSPMSLGDCALIIHAPNKLVHSFSTGMDWPWYLTVFNMMTQQRFYCIPFQ